MASITTFISLFIITICIYLKVSGQTSEKDEKQTDKHAIEGEKKNIFKETRPVKFTPKTRSRRSVAYARTRRDVTSLVAGLKANSCKLENLTSGVEYLVQSTKEQLIGYTAVTKRLEAINSVLMKRLEQMDSGLMNRLGQMNPFFVSMFVMLADVALSTSPRLGEHKEEAVAIANYFRKYFTTEAERNMFDKNMLSVFQWYSNVSSSCKSILESGNIASGVYQLRISNTELINVYCDQETDGGGWLVVQRREDGSENFLRSWSEYKLGFGDVAREFWLGNDYLHQLTRTKQELRVDIIDFDGNTAYAKYSSFGVGPESEYYKMTVSGYSGTAGDEMSSDSDGRFYLMDQGNSCVDSSKSPWWRKSCLWYNLNGVCSSLARDNDAFGTHLHWWMWGSKTKPLKNTEVKIRPSN